MAYTQTSNVNDKCCRRLSKKNTGFMGTKTRWLQLTKERTHFKGSIRQKKYRFSDNPRGSWQNGSSTFSLRHVHEPWATHFAVAKMSKTSSKGKGGRGNLSQCEWTHCCFGLIRRDKWGVNRFPSLGPLKSPLESMGHTPVRLSVYQPASLLPLLQDTGYSYSHPATANSNKATL